MKRIMSILSSFLIIAVMLCNNLSVCSANTLQYSFDLDEVLVRETVEQLPDGSSITITIMESPVATYATKYTKNGTKTYSARNSDGEIQWQFIVHGTFTVNAGVSSICTSASYSYNIENTNWTFNGGSAYATSNSAVGNGEFSRSIFFIPVETRECNVTLSCDNNGNLS